MKTIKVSEATNLQLDWLVWKCAGGIDAYPKTGSGKAFLKLWKGNTAKYVHPTTDWSQVGPIIERERINIFQADDDAPVVEKWSAQWPGWLSDPLRRHPYVRGSTPLIAAARCYVVSKMGDTVEVPEELA